MPASIENQQSDYDLESSEVFQGAILYLPEWNICKNVKAGEVITTEYGPFKHPVLVLSRPDEYTIDLAVITSCRNQRPAYGSGADGRHPQYAPIEDYIAIEPSPAVDCKRCIQPHPVLEHCNAELICDKFIEDYVCLASVFRLDDWRRLRLWRPRGQALNVSSMEIVLKLALTRHQYTPHPQQIELCEHLQRTNQAPCQPSRLRPRPCAKMFDDLPGAQYRLRRHTTWANQDFDAGSDGAFLYSAADFPSMPNRTGTPHNYAAAQNPSRRPRLSISCASEVEYHESATTPLAWSSMDWSVRS